MRKKSILQEPCQLVPRYMSRNSVVSDSRGLTKKESHKPVKMTWIPQSIHSRELKKACTNTTASCSTFIVYTGPAHDPPVCRDISNDTDNNSTLAKVGILMPSGQPYPWGHTMFHFQWVAPTSFIFSWVALMKLYAWSLAHVGWNMMVPTLLTIVQ